MRKRTLLESNISMSIVTAIFTFFLFSCNSGNQESRGEYTKDGVTVTMSYVDESTSFLNSSSHGDQLFEFNGKRILDVISVLSNISSQYFLIEGNSHNKLINLKIESKKNLSKQNALDFFLQYLEKKESIYITFPMREVLTFVASNEKPIALESCKEKFHQSKITSINRSWKGECVTLDVLIDQINDWYTLNIVNEITDGEKRDKRHFNITLQKANTYEELFKELEAYYNIVMESKKRKIKTIHIQFEK